VRVAKPIVSRIRAALLLVGGTLFVAYGALLATAIPGDFSAGTAVLGWVRAGFAVVFGALGVLAYRAARSPSAFPGFRLLIAMVSWAVAAFLAALVVVSFLPYCETIPAQSGTPATRSCLTNPGYEPILAIFVIPLYALGVIALRWHWSRRDRARAPDLSLPQGERPRP